MISVYSLTDLMAVSPLEDCITSLAEQLDTHNLGGLV